MFLLLLAFPNAEISLSYIFCCYFELWSFLSIPWWWIGNMTPKNHSIFFLFLVNAYAYNVYRLVLFLALKFVLFFLSFSICIILCIFSVHFVSRCVLFPFYFAYLIFLFCWMLNKDFVFILAWCVCIFPLTAFILCLFVSSFVRSFDRIFVRCSFFFFVCYALSMRIVMYHLLSWTKRNLLE